MTAAERAAESARARYEHKKDDLKSAAEDRASLAKEIARLRLEVH